MKTIVFICAFIFIFFSSCGWEPCTLDCGPHKWCPGDECVCLDGYEGANCDTAKVYKFAGTYFGVWDISNGADYADTIILISDSIGSTALRFDSLPVVLTRVSDQQYKVFSLPLDSTLEGTAALSNNNNTLILNYTTTYSAYPDSSVTHTYTGTRQ
jgi:hypothetical protein